MADRRSQPLRYRWDHRHPLHRALVRSYNRMVRFVPFGVKYRIGQVERRRKPPYRFVQPDSTVVQIGAPADTLDAGRSRAMHFALLTRGGGRTMVVEPDARSCDRWGEVLRANGLTHVTVVNSGAWSSRTTLRVRVDDQHPATNFTEGTAEYDDERAAEFRLVEIPSAPIDELCAEHGITKVDLLSVTTNGAEPDILRGAASLIAAGLPYVCVASTGDGYVEMLDGLGYELVDHDDRGMTFRQRA